MQNETPEPLTNDPLRRIMSDLAHKADTDLAAHVGKVLLVTHVDGYNDRDDSVTVMCDPPARMRVCRTSAEDVHRWVDNWLDPYWDVQEVEPHPALAGIRSMWVYGPSYCTDGRTEPSGDWTLEPTTLTQKLKDMIRR